MVEGDQRSNQGTPNPSAQSLKTAQNKQMKLSKAMLIRPSYEMNLPNCVPNIADT